ncbi:Fic family protein [Gorillibacterium sp. sgz500922]|uniref:Fic family protein n=1 Tax=Gorillibacterium sp. sgz500922 TaxID=3446694 RepID=UPI003F673038
MEEYYQLPSYQPNDDLLLSINGIQGIINNLNARRDRGLNPNLKEKIMRHLKISHVYNSNAIEGNILSLRETELILENLTVNERPFKDQVEARSLGVAIDYLYGLINGNEPINKVSLLNVHRLILGEIDIKYAGTTREENVIISKSVHTPPKWEYINDHLDDMFKWYDREKNISPIIKAAILHHWITWIHPFKDGNGRVSRLMLNFHLLQYGFPEVVIRVEDRDRYYNALSEADAGDITLLLELLCDKLYESVSIYEQFMNEEIREKEWVEKFSRRVFDQKIESARYNYEVWKSSMEVFRTRFIQTVNAIDSQLENINMYVRTYDIISLHQYLDIIENRSVSNTWFFKLRIKEFNGDDITFIFYFERWWPQKASHYKQNPLIKMFISVVQGGHSKRLDNSVDLVNVGVMKDRLVIGLRDRDIRNRVKSMESLPGPIITEFIDQILLSYFKFK